MMKQKYRSPWVIAAVLCAAALQMSGCATTGIAPSSQQAANNGAASPAEEAWGIKIIGIHLSSAGYMIDFRYRVTNPEKAATILDGRVHPYIIDQATGSKLGIPNTPKLGSLRQFGRQTRPDHVYFMLFANPGALVKAGNKVTLVVGDMQVENLVVESTDGKGH